MITVEEIRIQAMGFYPQVLRAALTGEVFFPKTLRANKTLSKDFVTMSREIALVMMDSKDRKGVGYRVQSAPVKTRDHGVQNIPTQIIFETVADYLGFIGRPLEYTRFIEMAIAILSRNNLLAAWVLENPLRVLAYTGKWEELLRVCDWFLNHFRPHTFYIRELPIAVHSKFIEENQGILRMLLDTLIPEKADFSKKEFEKRYGLKFSQGQVRFRYLNPAEVSPGGYLDMAVPVDQFILTPIACRGVVVIENKMTFLTFPRMEKTIAVWGQGFAIELLKNVRWLQKKVLFYWSDLDAQGFEMLSQLRFYFPQTRSLFMDQEVMDIFGDFAVKGTRCNKGFLPRLSPQEFHLFAFLCRQNLRLEQERISQAYVQQNMHELFLGIHIR